MWIGSTIYRQIGFTNAKRDRYNIQKGYWCTSSFDVDQYSFNINLHFVLASLSHCYQCFSHLQCCSGFTIKLFELYKVNGAHRDLHNRYELGALKRFQVFIVKIRFNVYPQKSQLLVVRCLKCTEKPANAWWFKKIPISVNAYTESFYVFVKLGLTYLLLTKDWKRLSGNDIDAMVFYGLQAAK